jgi:hypothetical protein
MFRRIKAILDSEDIEGLLALGCPPDEYDGEASLIESAIAKLTNFGAREMNAEHIEVIVARVWSDQFGPFDQGELQKRKPAFASVARKLMGS